MRRKQRQGPRQTENPSNAQPAELSAPPRDDSDPALARLLAAAALAPDDALLIKDVGHAFRERGRLDEAEAAFREASAKAPDLFEGRRGLGLVAQQRGDHAAALAYLQAASALAPDNVWLVNDIGHALRELGRLDEAEAAYGDVAAKAPHLFDGPRGLGLVAQQRRDHAAALGHFQAAIALAPDNVQLLTEIAYNLRELGRLDEAEAAYRDIATKAPALFEGPRGLGLVAQQRGDRAAALGHFREASARAPDNVWLINDLAHILRELGRFDEAEAAYRAVAAKAPHLLDGPRGLGLVAQQRGDLAAALGHFQAASALAPDNVWLINDLAHTLRELGRLEEAEAGYASVATKAPHLFDGPRGLGLIARQRGDFATSLVHFQAAAALAPDNVWLINDVATALCELRRHDEAEALLKAFIASHPDSAQALVALAHCIRRKASSSELFGLLRQAAAIETDDLSAKLTLANEYLQNWDLGAAEAIYDLVGETHGENPWFLLGKGHVARLRGDREQALDWYLRAEKTAAFESATIEIAKELADAGRYREAEDRLRAALTRKPFSAALHIALGQNARATGDYADARTAFAKAEQLDPGQEGAQIELAVEDLRQGRSASAVERLLKITDQRPNGTRALETLAHFAEQFDDLDAAAQQLQRACEVDPSNLSVRLRLADILAKSGKVGEADQTIEACIGKFGPLLQIAMAKAALLRERGDYESARALLDQARRDFPTNFEIWFHHVMALITCGAFDEARQALDASPRCSALEASRIYQLRGELAAAEWNFDQAGDFYREGLKPNPTDAWLNDRAALVAMLGVHPEHAQTYLEEAVRSNFQHRLTHNGAWKASQTHIGQLLDEYVIDKAALEQLRRAASAPDCVGELAKLVLKFPDYTPAAMTFLIAIRRSELLRAPTGDRKAGPGLIPLRLTQYWDDTIPHDVQTLCDGWRERHPDFSYARFDRKAARQFIADNAPREAVAAFDRAVEPAMQADIFRLVYLFREGGFYIDADDRCLAPIPLEAFSGRDLVLYQEDFGTVGNNFIGVRAGHPAIGLAMTNAITAVNRGDSDMLWLSTGPGLLTRSLAVHLAEDWPERIARTLILERYELFRIAALHTRTAYKQSKKHWTRTTFSRTPARLFAKAQAK